MDFECLLLIPIMLTVIGTYILAVITAAYPFLKQTLIQHFRYISLPECSPKGYTAKRIHRVWHEQSFRPA